MDFHVAAGEKPEIILDSNVVTSFQLMNGIYEIIKEFSMEKLYKKVKSTKKLGVLYE